MLRNKSIITKNESAETRSFGLQALRQQLPAYREVIKIQESNFDCLLSSSCTLQTLTLCNISVAKNGHQKSSKCLRKPCLPTSRKNRSTKETSSCKWVATSMRAVVAAGICHTAEVRRHKRKPHLSIESTGRESMRRNEVSCAVYACNEGDES
eukprot:1044533-Pelagomonas_calceolata.AAC.1